MSSSRLLQRLKAAEARFNQANADFSEKLEESGFQTFEALLSGSYSPAKTKEISNLYLKLSEARIALDGVAGEAEKHLEKAELSEFRRKLNGFVD